MIRGGARRGSNRIHSFERFSLNRGDTVQFVNDQTEVRNIIGRVTGGDPSRIFGQITAGGAAPDFDLYLLNSNGILFGDGAMIDINGAFFASTADALDFGELGMLSTSESSVPDQLLTINPTAFIFQNGQNAPIRFRDVTASGTSFSTPDNLAFIGGRFTSNNSTIVTDAPLDIVAVGSAPASIPIGRAQEDIQFDTSSLDSRSNIRLRESAIVLRDSAPLMIAGDTIRLVNSRISSDLVAISSLMRPGIFCFRGMG